MSLEAVLKMAEACGFSHVGELNVPALRFRQEVREMCSADLCHNYGRCWTCPPHCGTLEEAAEKARKYQWGILVQTTAELEDEFDVEVMMSTGDVQQERFYKLVELLREVYPNCLPMTCGGCKLCPKCSCPEAPCRFPDKAIPSMEAYGLVVSDTCTDSGMAYNYGKNTITYTGCVLVD